MTILTIIIFILILSVLVIVHELGHFFFARLFGVRVKEFGVGFPPRMAKLFSWKGTDFTLNWLPIGGFAAMESEDERPGEEIKQECKKDEGKFYCKKAWQRFLIVVAGPATNFALAMIIFMVVYGIFGVPQQVPNAVFIDSVEEDSPAKLAGLQTGVKILAIRNEAGEEMIPTQVDEVVDFIGKNKGRNLEIVTTGECKGGECAEIALTYYTYVRTDEEKGAGAGALGVALSHYQLFLPPWYQRIPLSIYYGCKQSLALAGEMIGGLGKLLAGLFVPQEKSNLVVMGPVGIVSELNRQQTFSEGFWVVIQFAGLLSLNLGIVNLLPIPAVDGGRLLLIMAEKCVGRRKVAKIEYGLNYFGFIFILALGVLVTGHDIWRIFKGS